MVHCCVVHSDEYRQYFIKVQYGWFLEDRVSLTICRECSAVEYGPVQSSLGELIRVVYSFFGLVFFFPSKLFVYTLRFLLLPYVAVGRSRTSLGVCENGVRGTDQVIQRREKVGTTRLDESSCVV